MGAATGLDTSPSIPFFAPGSTCFGEPKTVQLRWPSAIRSASFSITICSPSGAVIPHHLLDMPGAVFMRVMTGERRLASRVLAGLRTVLLSVRADTSANRMRTLLGLCHGCLQPSAFRHPPTLAELPRPFDESFDGTFTVSDAPIHLDPGSQNDSRTIEKRSSPRILRILRP